MGQSFRAVWPFWQDSYPFYDPSDGKKWIDPPVVAPLHSELYDWSDQVKRQQLEYLKPSGEGFTFQGENI